MALFLTIIIALSLILLAWAWVGYPLLLAGLARRGGSGERGARSVELGARSTEDREGGRRLEPACPPLAEEAPGPPEWWESRARIAERGAPRVSIVVAAYNEEKVIRARLDNLAACDPADGGYEILLGCDGCDDRTVEIVEAWSGEREREECGSGGVWECGSVGVGEWGSVGVGEWGSVGGRSRSSEERRTKNEERSTRVMPRRQTRPSGSTDNAARRGIRLRLFAFTERRGKPAVIKDLVAASHGEILLFTDANTQFAQDAMVRLLAPLADPEVGGVCGRLQLLGHGAAGRENLYWRFETWLKARESTIDSCLGANGAIYALRRELFWLDLPSTAIIDDFVLGMKVREQGKRMLYVPEAVACEDMPVALADEWRRRIRIGAGDYQAVGFCRGCLLPRHGFFALAFFSHKLLRWFTPHLMLTVLLASVVGLVWAQTSVIRLFFALIVTGQGLWYALALAGWASCSGLRAIYYFNAMQLALLCGFGRYLAGIRSGAWQRTAR